MDKFQPAEYITIVRDAMQSADTAAEMTGCTYEEAFPYMKIKIINGEDGRTYRVKVTVDLK